MFIIKYHLLTYCSRFALFQNGLRGNLETLVTLYADKFYTYEEDVFEALESLRVRQVGEMQEEMLQERSVSTCSVIH